MACVLLADIPALTFYADTKTAARRTAPLPQLVCVGAPCRQYTPDVVRCVNAGGRGTEVDWTCEADLPSSLRLGRVEVGCEGYSRPGDPYVLKGSCSLQYRLVRIPSELHDDGNARRAARFGSGWFDGDLLGMLFTLAWIACFVFIVGGLIRSCLRRPSSRRPSPGPGPGPRPGSGWFPGDTTDAPPPPYSDTYDSPRKPPPPAARGWGAPGFWAGTALGGLGAYLLNQRNAQPAPAQPYDWEWERGGFRGPRRRNVAFPVPGDRDRGEGSSNLGELRRSTGFGGSNVR